MDLIGLSILSGAHMVLVPRVIELLRRQRSGRVPVFVGGIIPDEDARQLKRRGVKAIFGPGAGLEEIVATARALARRRA